MQKIVQKQNKESQKESKENISLEQQSKQYPQIQFDEQSLTFIQSKLGDQSFFSTVINISYSLIKSYHLIYLLRQQFNHKNNKLINLNIIKQLQLNGNLISDQGIKQLCRKQYKYIKLQNLYLYKNYISMQGMQYLCQGAQMKIFPQLMILSLGDNYIGNNKQYTQPIQQKNKKQLKKQQGIIFKFANHNTKLKQLCLSKNNLNDKDMTKLFKRKCKSQFKKEENQEILDQQKIFNFLQVLWISQNNITKQGVKNLDYRKLKFQLPQLRNLSLSNNKINSKGFRYLFDSNSIDTHFNTSKQQKSSLKLQSLALENNLLCSQAMKCFVQNKVIFKNLQWLSLSNNTLIGDQGIQHFIKGCREKAFPMLQQLQIKNINLSNKGIESIIKQYHFQRSLISLQRVIIKENQMLIDKKRISKKLQNRLDQKIYLVWQKM